MVHKALYQGNTSFFPRWFRKRCGNTHGTNCRGASHHFQSELAGSLWLLREGVLRIMYVNWLLNLDIGSLKEFCKTPAGRSSSAIWPRALVFLGLDASVELDVASLKQQLLKPWPIPRPCRGWP